MISLRSIFLTSLYLILTLFNLETATAQELYYPPAGTEWQERSSARLGFDAGSLQQIEMKR